MIRTAGIVLSVVSLQVSAIALAGAEDEAREQLKIPDLQLVASHERPWSLAELDIEVGYVAQDTRPGGGKYHCGAGDADRVVEASQAVANALDRLDSGVVEEVGLEYLLLCGGLRAGSQAIGGVPLPPLGLLTIDLESSTRHLQHTTLHEFFHYAEYRTGTASDAEWRRRFGGYQGGFTTSTEIGTGSAGFVDKYAMTSPQEDRAELFAHLVMQPDAVRRLARRQGDDVLEEKIEYLNRKFDEMFDSRTSDL